MSELAAPFEWYDYRAIKSRNALISIVGGPRSIGKTYGAKMDWVRLAIKSERQFMWVRRSNVELLPAKEGFFDAIKTEYPGFEFRLEGNRGQVRKDGKGWIDIVLFVPLPTPD